MIQLAVFTIILTTGLVIAPPPPNGFDDIPPPIKVSSFPSDDAHPMRSDPDSEPPASAHPYPGTENQIYHQIQSTGQTRDYALSSGPWSSLTSEPVPQSNLRVPEGTPKTYRGVPGSYRCVPNDGCYFGYWNLYQPSWYPSFYSGSYFMPYYIPIFGGFPTLYGRK